MKKIAVDAMGGDNAPKAIIEGVNRALAEFSDIEIQLYGDESKIKEYLTATERVSIIHTEEKINSDDEPAKAIRRKKKASMVLGANAVKKGQQTLSFQQGIQVRSLRQDCSLLGVLKVLTVQGLCPLCQHLMVEGMICWTLGLMLRIPLNIYISMLF